MSLQVAGMGEAAVADGAAERPLACVHVAVDVQLALAHEALATHLTGVGFLPGVPGHVLLQVRLQEETLGAAGAAIWPLHGDSVVEGQVEVAGRFLVAVAGLADRVVQSNAGGVGLVDCV